MMWRPCVWPHVHVASTSITNYFTLCHYLHAYKHSGNSITVDTLLHVSGYYTGVFSFVSLGSNATTVLERVKAVYMQCRTIRPTVLYYLWFSFCGKQPWNPGFREAALYSYAYSSHLSALGFKQLSAYLPCTDYYWGEHTALYQALLGTQAVVDPTAFLYFL